jgi:capsid protein
MLRTLRKSVASLLGYGGQPAPVANAAVSADVLDQLLRQRQHGSYDASRTTDEFSNYWGNADAYDADSAHSKGVRDTLRNRSRYENGNNPYSSGIASTYCTDLVGVGPTLRMQTGSQPFNQMVELSWFLWCKAIQFRRKLWCMSHAKHVDGEAFAVIRRNPGINHPIKLDIQLYEAEQVSTPYPPLEDGYIDGIKFDQFGNPLWYDVLQSHPGSSSTGFSFNQTAERVDASLMLHWLKLKRPGQHRGVPDCVSSLNAGAAARRWREATLSAAERAALLTLMMKTQLTPDEVQAVAAFSTLEPQKGAMNFLPAGWDPFQADGVFPTASHEAFHKSLINEQARPVSMPYNKAACDSSSYNYASGRLDHQTYYGQLDVDREDANDLVLDRLFDVWFDQAVVRFGWLGGNPDIVGPGARVHLWDWPKHRVADVESEANANKTRLQSGQTFLHNLASDAGIDFEDELEKAAESYGVTVEELRSRILDTLYPPVQQGGAPGKSPIAADDAAVSSVLRRMQIRSDSLAVKSNGNGHTNGVHDEN